MASERRRRVRRSGRRRVTHLPAAAPLAAVLPRFLGGSAGAPSAPLVARDWSFIDMRRYIHVAYPQVSNGDAATALHDSAHPDAQILVVSTYTSPDMTE